MRGNFFHGSILGLIAIGLASVALAEQQPGSADRSPENQTLFDLLQSRLQASGLMPVDAPETVPIDEPSYPSLGPRASTALAANPRQPVAASSVPVGMSTADAARPLSTAATDPIVTGTGGGPSPANVSPPAMAETPAMSSRMHQRLSAFRDSQFSPSQPPSALQQDAPAASPPVAVVTRPRRASGPVVDPAAKAQQPTLAPPREASQEVARQPQGGGSPIAERISRPPTEPLPARGLDPPDLTSPAKPAGIASRSGSDRALDPGVGNAALAPGTEVSPSPQVLFVRQSPILNVKTIGPERIDVGRESVFNVTIENLGAVAAEDLKVAIDLPEWADLVAAEASAGTTASEAAPGGKGVFRWNVGRLAAKEDQTVVLHLVARQSQPFDLAVNLHYAPVASGAKITVLEPNLTLKLEGPENVLFGKKQVYRLKVANTGTGDARGVEISLLPRGTGQTKPAVQAIGILPAGRERTVEVDLTPRDEGDLVIEVDATAEGGARAHLAEKIAVLKPALAVEIAAPGFQFVGKEITCQIVVTNPGTAAAEEVTLEAILPELVGYLSGTQEGLVAAEAGRVRWQLGQLAPQQSRTLEVKCSTLAAGIGRIKAESRGGDGLQAAGEAAVEIDAIADLTLKVADPSGPIPVGTETEYTLTVENRGSRDAETVEVVAYFSNGIEPISATGASHKIGPGQVVFDAIDAIGPGETKTLTVKARAETTGNHIVRAEIFCKPLGTRLVAEESTYYYDRRTNLPEPVPARAPTGQESLTAKPGNASRAR
jgi:hypothetical protein